MRSRTYDMLPKAPGPKLGKFKNGKHAKVHFVTGLGSGAHSHVWKVTINGGTYALKMFRHIKAEEENAASATKLDKFGVDLQLLNDQLTPFNCEARAYGRLRETGNEGIAWGCYGYIALDEATYASAVWDTIGLPRREWFSQYINTDAEVADRPVFPIYALVKEFIPDASKLGALDISKAHDMAQGINKLHSIGITHRDIQDRNYVDSRIMDFSTSWTVPNIRLDRALKWDPKKLIDEADTSDYFMFDDMIEKWNAEHPDQPPSSYRMTQGEKYRPKTKKASEGGGPAAKRRKSSSSSGSSEDMEEIPILERMRDNRYLVLASSYDWMGKKPAVARPDIIAPSTPSRDGGSSQGADRAPARPGISLPGVPTTPDSSPAASSTPPKAIVAGPSKLNNGQSTPGPGPRNGREASKLEAIREAAGGMSSACDTLRAMAENIIDIIDRDDSSGPGVSGVNGKGKGGDVPSGTPQQQQKQQQQKQKQKQKQKQAARLPGGAAARPNGTGRRKRREDDEDGDNSGPPARNLRPRPRQNRVRYDG